MLYCLTLCIAIFLVTEHALGTYCMSISGPDIESRTGSQGCSVLKDHTV